MNITQHHTQSIEFDSCFEPLFCLWCKKTFFKDISLYWSYILFFHDCLLLCCWFHINKHVWNCPLLLLFSSFKLANLSVSVCVGTELNWWNQDTMTEDEAVKCVHCPLRCHIRTLYVSAQLDFCLACLQSYFLLLFLFLNLTWRVKHLALPLPLKTNLRRAGWSFPLHCSSSTLSSIPFLPFSVCRCRSPQSYVDTIRAYFPTFPMCCTL